MTPDCIRASRLTAAVAGVVATLVLPVASASARSAAGRAGLFERLAGAWSGSGAAAANGVAERVTCSVQFSPTGATQVHMTLRCASGAYQVAVDGDLSCQGNRVDGSLVERSFGVTGSLSGTMGADRLSAVVTGMGLSARLSMTMRGGIQAVTLQGLGSLSAGAAVTLRRA